jgi:hypothetical protein
MASCSRSGTGDVSSIPYHAAYHLEEEGFLLFNESAELEVQRSIESVWREIVDLLSERRRNTKVRDKGKGLELLTRVMTREYARVVEFDKELFLALREVLTSHQLILPLPKHNGRVLKNPEDYPIVFKFRMNNTVGTSNYAIGIARDLNGEQKFNDNGKATASVGESGSTRSEVAADCKADHCTCLLKSENGGEWIVVEVLSVMELKISEVPSFAQLNIRTENARLVEHFPLEDCPPVAEVMSYTMGSVLPSHAKLGELNGILRWVVLIGKKGGRKDDEGESKKKKRKVESRRTLAVGGKIYVPEACGRSFQYAVTGYVRSAEQEDSNCAILEALTLYLETMLFGIEAGKGWMVAPQPVDPKPTSGQRVMFGPANHLQPLKWRGSATLGKLLTADQEAHPEDDNKHWKISQGEIFTGELNMHHIKAKMLHSMDCVFFNTVNKNVPVVVKVFSLAVHRYLIHPDKSCSALDKIHRAKLSAATRKALSRVLYAVYQPPIGMITIMADLTKEGYKVLHPHGCVSDTLPLAKLWEAFTTLVETVLLPIAQIGCIHPDVRAGFDVTSNILCQVKGKGKSRQASMCLIDYESFVVFSLWQRPISKEFKFIRSDNSWSAETFVWWQCLAVAYAWVEAKRQGEMEQENLERKITTVQWLKQFRGSAANRNLGATDVKTLLMKLGKVIRHRSEKTKSDVEARAKPSSE